MYSGFGVLGQHPNTLTPYYIKNPKPHTRHIITRQEPTMLR